MPFKYFNLFQCTSCRPTSKGKEQSRKRIVKDIPRPDKGINTFQWYCFLSHRGYRLQSWSKSEKVINNKG